ncbi:MAG TPA: ABC transporter permease [Phycisphaerae bacterium]|nr:ABC transporter permease [Phycisphaerae bacterium]
MMIQTWALLVDAYRELNSKKMFWIVLILTAVVLAAFATLGVSGDQLTVLWYAPFGHVPGAIFIYKTIFSYLVVGIWFTWIAVLLALISTAGIFPDFLSAGSIDLYLAKPIGRLRLFFTKYVAGLLFVLLQVAFFAVVSFFILGVRGHSWQPGLFWSIPIILLFFSYLYAICTLLGVMTRSTVAALLLTLLVWFGIWGVDAVDRWMVGQIEQQQMMAEDTSDQIDQINQRIAADPASATQAAPGDAGDAFRFYRMRAAGTAATASSETLEESREDLKLMRDENVRLASGFQTADNIVVLIKSFIPKTRETTNLLDRVLFSDKDLQAATQAAAGDQPTDERSRRRQERIAQSWIDPMRNRSAVWVVGTSLAFEAVVLGVAAWLFCRRDY